MFKSIFLFLSFLPFILSAQIKSFDSALGDGAYTTGGRGGLVVHVTNLNDSGSGSFRSALELTVPRIIVFDISGVITLSSLIALDATNSNLTIAGQTAPLGGITITGNRIYMSHVSNVICRYIRFKGATNDNDSLTVTGNIQDMIFDHCSFGFGRDEGASWYSGTTAGTNQNKITIQRCLWNENSKGSIIGKLGGNGGLPPTGTYIYNMFYNSGYRFPNVAGGDGVGQFDVINNVSWNVSNRLIRGNGSFKLNHIGNYYQYGTRGITNSRTNLFRHGDIPQIYNRDNKIVAQYSNTPLTYTVSEMNLDNNKSWGFFQDGGGYDYGDRLPSNYFSSVQHVFLGVSYVPMDAENTLTNVLNDVGANKTINADGTSFFHLDDLDSNALEHVRNGVFVSKISESAYNVPPIASIVRPASYDTDLDGMPDIWETIVFGDLNRTASGDADNDGYTNIEEFINLVDLNNITLTPVNLTPQNLTASATTSTSTTITWSTVSNATSYDIIQNDNLVSSVINGTTYNASGLTPNSQINFQVVAKDVGGSVIGSSQVITVITLLEALPVITNTNNSGLSKTILRLIIN